MLDISFQSSQDIQSFQTEQDLFLGCHTPTFETSFSSWKLCFLFSAFLISWIRLNYNLHLYFSLVSPVISLYYRIPLIFSIFHGWIRRTDFNYQVLYLAPIRHRNLVTLLGYCQEKNQQFLIYEYIPNGSVSSHLYGNSLSSLRICFHLA